MNRPDRHLDLDEIEARANAASGGPWEWCDYGNSGQALIQPGSGTHDLNVLKTTDDWPPNLRDATFIAHARTDVPALIAEVKRLRGEVAGALAEGWDQGFLHSGRRLDNPHRVPHPEHDHEWKYDRSVCGFCGGNHGYCECGETEPCDTPQPDPLDAGDTTIRHGRTGHSANALCTNCDPLNENDHRDRIDARGGRWTRRKVLWCHHPCSCERGAWKFDDLADRFGPLTFADDPQTPPQAPRRRP